MMAARLHITGRHAGCTEVLRRLHGSCMEAVWKLYEGCLDARRLRRGCMEVFHDKVPGLIWRRIVGMVYDSDVCVWGGGLPVGRLVLGLGR